MDDLLQRALITFLTGLTTAAGSQMVKRLKKQSTDISNGTDSMQE